MTSSAAPVIVKAPVCRACLMLICVSLLFRNKYLLLNSQELNELSAISMKANIPEVEALVNTDRSLVCDGKKGLLTRILAVMKREPPDSSFRSAPSGPAPQVE